MMVTVMMSHLLENVGYASAWQLKSEIDPKGSDHYKSPGYTQHSPRWHLVHKLSYFENLQTVPGENR